METITKGTMMTKSVNDQNETTPFLLKKQGKGLFDKLLPSRPKSVGLTFKGRRLAVVTNAKSDVCNVDVSEFLICNIQSHFADKLNVKVLTMVCSSLKCSNANYDGKDFKDIIRIYHIQLQRNVNDYDLTLAGQLLKGTAIHCCSGTYIRLHPIELPYELRWPENVNA